MIGFQIETPPLAEPILLADAKNYLKIDNFTNDDSLILGMIVAARQMVEAFTSRSLVNKGYVQTMDAFPYFVDSTMSQQAYPPAYYSAPRYATTFWNYSQQIKLLASPLVRVSRILYLGTDEQWHSLLQGAPLWRPQTGYPLGAQVVDGNGNLQTVIVAPGNSAAQPPNTQAGAVSGIPLSPVSWSLVIGGVTTETTGLQWQCNGPDPLYQLGASNLASNTFLVDALSEPPRVFPGPAGATWPPVIFAPAAVEIHFVAGYGDAVPTGSPVTYLPPNPMTPDGTWSKMVTAMYQLIAGWYENRESLTPLSMKEMPSHVKSLLWSSRILDLSPTRG